MPDEIFGWQSNEVLADLEDYLERERSVNAAIHDSQELYNNVHVAIEMLDSYILNQLTRYFGATQIVVVDVIPLPGIHLHYDITVEIHYNRSVY